MKLEAPSIDDCLKVAVWRNKDISGLRTPYRLTEKQQVKFYHDVVCQSSNHRYWSIVNPELIGFGGITNVQWENRIGEISLIINPKCQKEGFGKQAADLLLYEAFNCLNLKTVFGECYHNNPALSFWEKITKKYNGYITTLPSRKYWDGKYWDATYFSIEKDEFNKVHSAV